ncbi:ankyrin repeat and BTB/POZ domain-containing protein BTBD11-like [Actinia tenebrosa]|uniref:Ankyrin repeat and BTB/POZ domain-containing protein BTBD11-like n=1 Tax=Actinia tenebrosa TaxID=6105 RepID=A0A6P8IRE0_ACTTE|nr:ankyrin repeat and BTB/POZ domain-containing protein BTBD11-like [Actinia tenebrosa]
MSGLVGLVTDTHTQLTSTHRNKSTSWDTWLPMLPDLSANFPWSLNDVSKVLRLGRAREHFRAISPQTIERVCFLLQRPLLRIVIEAERLSHEMERCTKRELQTSLRLILSPSLAKNCLQVASKALLLYSTSGEQQFQRCKRARSGLIFPVGRIFGWLVEMKVSRRVYDAAAIYLSAALEFIAEETVYRAVLLTKDTVDQVTPEMIEDCINSDPDLWCLYQPYVHLLSGRTSFGLIDTLEIYACRNKSDKSTTKPKKAIEPYFITTCVSSVDELKEILPRVQHRFSQMDQYKENRMLCQVEWLPSALDTLFYFMTCHHNQDSNIPIHILWNNKRTHHGLPPLTEWIRVAGVHADHRSSGMVDDDDVRQAARLLLPFNICNYRVFGPDSSRCASRAMTSSEAEMSFKMNLGLRMLLSGRNDLVSKALAISGNNEGNSLDERCLTPLMYACAQGNTVLVQTMVNNHVLLDTKVPRDKKPYPLCDPGLSSWTALSFAVTKGHLKICQMLLDAGANVDGALDTSDISEGVETPLQMAVTAGNYDLVALLCARKADVNVVFPVGVGKLGFGSPFAAAAAFGYRKILRKSLAEAPSTQEDEMMSLAEILAEGSPSCLDKAKRSLSKKRCRALQEAMYHSCEHGYLDVAMEIRSLGVSWNLHCWSQALFQAYNLNITSSMTSQIRCLLRDFHSISQSDYTAEFCDDGLTLLFTIFKECQDQELLQELASVLSSCYGDEFLPLIKELPSTTTEVIKIGANYVNNHEMADVTFIVENQPFYGHRIILTAASSAFKEILSSKPRDHQDSSIEIPDIKYDIFSLLMQHVYTGRVDDITAKHAGKLVELLHASFVFKLKALQRHCEKLLSENVHSKNVIKIYKCSRRYKADSLALYCECFILSNMKDVVVHGDLGALILTDQGSATLSSLHRCLSERIKARVSSSPRKSLF